MPFSRPDVLLIYTATPHALHSLLGLLLINTALLGNNLAKDFVNLASHMRCVTADVEVGLLRQKLVDEGTIFLQHMLDINLLVALTGKCIENDELVA